MKAPQGRRYIGKGNNNNKPHESAKGKKKKGFAKDKKRGFAKNKRGFAKDKKEVLPKIKEVLPKILTSEKYGILGLRNHVLILVRLISSFFSPAYSGLRYVQFFFTKIYHNDVFNTFNTNLMQSCV
jgi:hypothetical protein